MKSLRKGKNRENSISLSRRKPNENQMGHQSQRVEWRAGLRLPSLIKPQKPPESIFGFLQLKVGFRQFG